MKSMKKLVTLLLSLVMLCALAMPAMAADATYSITINGAKDHTYTAYQVLSGVYFHGDGKNNTDKNKEYLSDIKWGDAIDQTKILGNLQGSTIIGSDFTGEKSAEEVAYILQGYANKSEKLDEFARIVNNSLKADATGKISGVVGKDKITTIDELSAGYYFVKDTGTINDGEIATKFLVEVVGNANVTVKAQAPEFEKKVVNGSADKGTSVNVGDKVTFQLTAKVPDMASFDDYTFTMYDTLSEGLTFNADSVKVTINNNGPVDANKYKLTYIEGEQNFTIAFTKAQLKDLVKHTGGTGEETAFGATIVVEYNATLNKNALTTDKENNTAYLKYTNDPSGSGTGTKKTPDAPVYVYDFDLTVDKFDGTENDAVSENSKRLKDATFILYKVKDGKNLYYVQDKTTKDVTWIETEADATKFTTDVNGKATFQGIAAGTYYLRETQAPAGYNSLKKDVKVEITATYKENGELLDSSATSTNNKQYVQVQSIANKAGAVLPSTGGIGTTIFYVLGSILALGAAVLLIAKKRMNGQDR